MALFIFCSNVFLKYIEKRPLVLLRIAYNVMTEAVAGPVKLYLQLFSNYN